MLKVVIVGPGGAGKTTLAERMKARGARVSTSYTTRPMREGEQHNASYVFVKDDEFDRLKNSNRFLETAEFNGWKYGTPLDNWTYYDVFIMTPSGLKQLPEALRVQAVVIYLDPPPRVLRQRLEKRLDADSVQRRRMSDLTDFEAFKDFDVRIDNAHF